MVITFNQVSFSYIDKPILDNVSFSITDSDKLGIVGNNGCGKSTLLKLILNEEKPKAGKINISGNLKISYLEQEPKFINNISIFEAVKRNRTANYEIPDFEIATVLNKLKLFDHNMLTNNLSGGERKRVALACALLKECDILMLDEPTNHLDQEMIIWLEGYLKKWKKGLIMVTHDRYFLERVCKKMLEIDFARVYLYEANYEKYLELRAERIENELHLERKHKSLYKHELMWIRRGVEARRTKSKSRVERFEELAKKKFQTRKEFSFSSLKTYLGKKLITIHNGSKAYGDKVLFNNFNFELNRYDRIGVVGNNGCGKSTLFKILMGEEQLTKGVLEVGETLKIGYMSQHLEISNENITVLKYIEEVSNSIESIDGVINAKELLENFLFEDEKIYGYVKLLSGGEKRRLQFIRVIMQNPNVLILDEPTNDLDLQTLEILEDYLEEFLGPVIVVSHDRYFLDKVCDSLLVFENIEIHPYLIKFSDFINQEKTKAITNKKENTRPKRRVTSTIRNEYNSLMQEMENIELEISKIEEEMKKEASSYMTLMDLSKREEELKAKLDKKMNRYLELDEFINKEE